MLIFDTPTTGQMTAQMGKGAHRGRLRFKSDLSFGRNSMESNETTALEQSREFTEVVGLFNSLDKLQELSPIFGDGLKDQAAAVWA